jgi:hypothetical protein
MKNEQLCQICVALDSILADLHRVKDSIEQGQIPFSDQDYFNIAVAGERIQEAKERLETTIQRD